MFGRNNITSIFAPRLSNACSNNEGGTFLKEIEDAEAVVV